MAEVLSMSTTKNLWISMASNPKLSKIGAIMADAFEKEGVYSLISPEVEHRLARAVETAAKELVKIV